jgi:predicted transcriptional regulator
MDEMMNEVFEALLEAGATEVKAKEAARAVTRHGQDLLQDINQRLSVLNNTSWD